MSEYKDTAYVKHDPGIREPHYGVWHEEGSDFWCARHNRQIWQEWLSEVDAYKWVAWKMNAELDAAYAEIEELRQARLELLERHMNDAQIPADNSESWRTR